MARPPQLTADYFPHDAHASNGDPVTILENYFGLEGYAIWFKLKEVITSSKNHVIDVRNPDSLESLAARLKLKSERLLEIVSKMASIEAIDPQLWEVRTIWCQEHVDDLSHLYQRRKQEAPHKPDVSSYRNSVPVSNNPVSSIDNAQRRVKERKGEEREIDTRVRESCPFGQIIDLWKQLVPSLPEPEGSVDSSSSRGKTIRVRWQQNPDIEVFRAIFSKVEASDFLTGRNGKWTACSIDWVLKSSNWQKVKEGNYGNKGVSHERVPATGYHDPADE